MILGRSSRDSLDWRRSVLEGFEDCEYGQSCTIPGMELLIFLGETYDARLHMLKFECGLGPFSRREMYGVCWGEV